MHDMKVYILLLTSILCTLSSKAQESNAIGSIFPHMETESADSKIVFPDDLKGKYSIIGLAYSIKSGEKMPDWVVPVYQEFISGSKDVNAYFVYMFSGVNMALKDVVKNKMINEMDPELLPHTVFETGDLKKYQKFLDMLGRKDTPYFFVLDPEGKILWATRGTCRVSKIDKLASYID